MAYAYISVDGRAGDAGSLVLQLSCTFYGPDVIGGPDTWPTQITVIPGESHDAMRTRMTEAAQGLIAATGVPYTVASRDMLLPGWVAGSL